MSVANTEVACGSSVHVRFSDSFNIWWAIHTKRTRNIIHCPTKTPQRQKLKHTHREETNAGQQIINRIQQTTADRLPKAARETRRRKKPHQLPSTLLYNESHVATKILPPPTHHGCSGAKLNIPAVREAPIGQQHEGHAPRTTASHAAATAPPSPVALGLACRYCLLLY